MQALRAQHWDGMKAGFGHAVPGGAELIDMFDAALAEAKEGNMQ
ncbi:hypothetical protein [Tropicibacter naphthalenivorans]|nr:hypothetical protein [Tropicibacter naphthalenivorans]